MMAVRFSRVQSTPRTSVRSLSLSRKLLVASSGIRCCRLQPAPFLSLSLKSLFPTVFVSPRATCFNFILSAILSSGGGGHLLLIANSMNLSSSCSLTPFPFFFLSLLLGFLNFLLCGMTFLPELQSSYSSLCVIISLLDDLEFAWRANLRG